MSFDLKRIFGKSAPQKDKSCEQSQQFRKSLRERLEAARLSGSNYDNMTAQKALYFD